jgi:hypothetical protein
MASTPLLLFGIANPRYTLKEAYARLHVSRMEVKRQCKEYQTKVVFVALIPLVLVMINQSSQVLASEDLTNVTMNNSIGNQSVLSSTDSPGANQTLSVPTTIFQRILSNANQSLNAFENEDMEIAMEKISSVYSDLKELANSSTSQS